ncbi:hypothetical protein FACS189472_07140 [Alphaproteobacteria bacterium]|nr:hypothetical protein FACS189472_07140 [Alphaproteobacteria bacterium]
MPIPTTQTAAVPVHATEVIPAQEYQHVPVTQVDGVINTISFKKNENIFAHPRMSGFDEEQRASYQIPVTLNMAQIPALFEPNVYFRETGEQEEEGGLKLVEMETLDILDPNVPPQELPTLNPNTHKIFMLGNKLDKVQQYSKDNVQFIFEFLDNNSDPLDSYVVPIELRILNPQNNPIAPHHPFNHFGFGSGALHLPTENHEASSSPVFGFAPNMNSSAASGPFSSSFVANPVTQALGSGSFPSLFGTNPANPVSPPFVSSSFSSLFGANPVTPALGSSSSFAANPVSPPFVSNSFSSTFTTTAHEDDDSDDNDLTGQ